MLAKQMGWLSVDDMLANISRRDFNEHYALAALECREQEAAYSGSTSEAAVTSEHDEDAFWRQQCGM